MGLQGQGDNSRKAKIFLPLLFFAILVFILVRSKKLLFMKVGKVILFVLFAFAFSVTAQNINPVSKNPNPNDQAKDELLKRLSAAESYRKPCHSGNRAPKGR
jgi:hypothetical protein